MSDVTERAKCPRCGKPAPLVDRACPHCKGSLLVDVVVDSAPADPRKRYQLAKSLSGLPAPAPSFTAAHQALAIPHSVLMEGTTRAAARPLLDMVQEHGGRGSTTPHVAEAAVEVPERSGSSRFTSTVVLLGLIALATWAWRWQLRHAPTEISLPEDRTVAVAPSLDANVLAAGAAPATVGLRCAGSQGSAFFVTPDLALTQTRLLCPPGEPLRATLADGRTATAQPVQRDEWLGLALVRIPGARATPLPLGDAMSLRTGDRVVLVGRAERAAQAAQQAVVQNTARSTFGLAFLEIDGNAGAGNAGGALLDGQGRVVGILTTQLDRSDGRGYVLPINYAYTGETRLLQPPAQIKPDGERWTMLLGRVAEADRREASRFATEPPQPALLDLASRPGQGLVAVVARRAVPAPREESLSLLFRDSGRILCEVQAVARDWRKADGAAVSDLQGAGSHPYLRWLRKNNLLGDVYISAVPLALGDCPADELADAEAVLQEGDERANRLGM